MENFQKCPNCGNDTFVELCLEWTAQEGVIINDLGEPDYDKADTVESIGDVVSTQFMCKDCDSTLIVFDGVLTEYDQECPEIHRSVL